MYVRLNETNSGVYSSRVPFLIISWCSEYTSISSLYPLASGKFTLSWCFGEFSGSASLLSSCWLEVIASGYPCIPFIDLICPIRVLLPLFASANYWVCETGCKILGATGCKSNFMLLAPTPPVMTSRLAKDSLLSWRVIPLHVTGAAPVSKATVRSTSFGMSPRSSSTCMP